MITVVLPLSHTYTYTTKHPVMTFQEKQTYIQEATRRVNNGLSWPVLESELKNKAGIYQKDVDDIARKVLLGVEQIHGSRIQDHLMADQKDIPSDKLHHTVFRLIRGRQEEAVRNTLKNRIARDLADGVPSAQVMGRHKNHLLTESDLQRAVQKARNRVQVQAEEQSDRSPLSLILGILFLVGGIIATVASDGQAIFYGAILVGLINIGKYAMS